MLHSASVTTWTMVQALFVIIVSLYTTEQGMALYLAPWFAVLASLGVQGALVIESGSRSCGVLARPSR